MATLKKPATPLKPTTKLAAKPESKTQDKAVRGTLTLKAKPAVAADAKRTAAIKKAPASLKATTQTLSKAAASPKTNTNAKPQAKPQAQSVAKPITATPAANKPKNSVIEDHKSANKVVTSQLKKNAAEIPSRAGASFLVEAKSPSLPKLSKASDNAPFSPNAITLKAPKNTKTAKPVAPSGISASMFMNDSRSAKASFLSPFKSAELIHAQSAVLGAANKKPTKASSAWQTKALDALSDADVLAMPVEAYMNATQMAFFRLKLVTLKNTIISQASQTTEHLREDTSIVPDPTDRATIEEEHALELRTRDRERKLLKKIESSIERIDSDDYGYCDETGEPIGLPRLIARPTATLSLEAQQRRELKQKLFGD